MQIHRVIVAGLIFGLTVAVGGCASTGDSSSSTSSTSSASSSSEAAPTTTPVPANSRLAKVDIGMNEIQVRGVLGEPSNVRSYPTAKNWIPFYFGGDTVRQEWIYSRVGRVVFSNSSRFSRTFTVSDRIHNPDES